MRQLGVSVVAVGDSAYLVSVRVRDSGGGVTLMFGL